MYVIIQKRVPKRNMDINNDIAKGNKSMSRSIINEKIKWPTIPPILAMIPVNALAVPLNSGTETSE